jgi:hypothetical protein
MAMTIIEAEISLYQRELGAICAALDDEGRCGEAKASTIYLALGCEWTVYKRAEWLGLRLGMWTQSANTLLLTEKGREIGKAVSAALKSA